MNLRTGWTPRILGAVLALFVGGSSSPTPTTSCPPSARWSALGPAALPIGLALVALGVLNRGLQAHASFRLVELAAPFAPMVNLSAMSYATNKVVKSAGTAGLVPYLAHADRAGQQPARVDRRLPLGQARRDHLALLPDRRAPSSPAPRRAGCTVPRLYGAHRVGGVRGRRRRRAGPRSPVAGRWSKPSRDRVAAAAAFRFRDRFGRPHP